MASLQYRIKSAVEQHERIAFESELSGVLVAYRKALAVIIRGVTTGAMWAGGHR